MRDSLNTVAKQLHDHFLALDEPQAKSLEVPKDKIRRLYKEDDNTQNTYSAVLEYTVEYCGTKTHTVEIEFQVSRALKVLFSSVKYI